MLRRVVAAWRLPVVLAICGCGLVGCPDGDDGSSWRISIHGDANPGNGTPGGLHGEFHWDL